MRKAALTRKSKTLRTNTSGNYFAAAVALFQLSAVFRPIKINEIFIIKKNKKNNSPSQPFREKHAVTS